MSNTTVDALVEPGPVGTDTTILRLRSSAARLLWERLGLLFHVADLSAGTYYVSIQTAQMFVCAAKAQGLRLVVLEGKVKT